MKDQPRWKKDKLRADSVFYRDQAGMYEQFSQAEDAPKKVAKFFRSRIKGKAILDFGCGTGKLIPELAPLAQKYFAVDVSESQLAIAKKKTQGFNNVIFIRTDGKRIPLESGSIDVIFSAWVIGSIHDLEIRGKVLNELKRIGKTNGSIYLVENDIGGEFKEIIEGEVGNKKTRRKQEWLEQFGFKKIKSFKTNFRFAGLENAKDVFGAIWGKSISAKIKSEKIAHGVAIYEDEK